MTGVFGCARLLGYTPQYLNYYIKNGRFPAHKEVKNGRRLWLKSDIIGWKPVYKRAA